MLLVYEEVGYMEKYEKFCLGKSKAHDAAGVSHFSKNNKENNFLDDIRWTEDGCAYKIKECKEAQISFAFSLWLLNCFCFRLTRYIF